MGRLALLLSGIALAAVRAAASTLSVYSESQRPSGRMAAPGMTTAARGRMLCTVGPHSDRGSAAGASTPRGSAYGTTHKHGSTPQWSFVQ